MCVCVCEREISATFSLGSEGQLEVRSQARSLYTQQERGEKREVKRGRVSEKERESLQLRMVSFRVQYRIIKPCFLSVVVLVGNHGAWMILKPGV